MGKYFGTDGFRGEANVNLTVDHAFKIGKFLGWYFGRNHKAQIVIGKDTRRSSYMFECALASGITAAGGDACAFACYSAWSGGWFPLDLASIEVSGRKNDGDRRRDFR